MKKLIFLFYIWITTFAWITLIFFLSLTTQELNSSNTLLAVIINTLLLTFLLLLIYRSALASVRIKVIRLSVSHTKQEAKEDKEFSDLVRVLLVIISILSTFLISFSVEIIQSTLSASYVSFLDIAINSVGIILGVIIVWIIPSLVEIEEKLVFQS